MINYHARAIVEVGKPEMNMWDLALELYSEYGSPPSDFVADDFDPVELNLLSEDGRNTLDLTGLLDIADLEGHLDRLTEKYDLQFKFGCIGYGPLTKIVWVVPEGATELPDKLKGKAGVQAVRYVHDEEEE